MASLVAGQFNLRGDSSKFRVDFDDGQYDLGSWSRATGLSVKWDTVEYRAGDYNRVWSAPGIAKYSTISLSRATCPDSQFVQHWLIETSQEPKVFSGCVRLLSWTGISLCEWPLRQFIPIGWKVADLDSKAATVVIETLDLAHTGFLEDDVKLGKGQRP
jgi:phage tail-like protein